jgi:hypothetical protein
MEEQMSNQSHHTTDLPIDRADLERAQDDLQTANADLHDTLEQMIDALDTGRTLDPELFQEAEEHIKELEVQANTLRKDLEKLQQP